MRPSLVILGGLAATGLAAVASAKPWLNVAGPSSPVAVRPELPLAHALALVALAAWGVLLLTRGRTRRLLGLLAAVSGLGVGAVALLGRGELHTQARALGVTAYTWTAWYWVTIGAAIVVSAAGTMAAARAHTWPAMGRRYDGPAQAPGEAGNSSRDWWQALDEGADPTA